MATPNATTSSIISLVMNEVRQSLEPKISHILTDYQTYKATHDALLQIPFIKHLLDNQCKCHATQAVQSTSPEPAVHDEPIHLEIIDGVAHGLPNLDSIAEYINATIDENSDHETVSEIEPEEDEESSESEVEEEAEAVISEAVISEAVISEAVISEEEIRKAVISEADQDEEEISEADQEEEEISEADQDEEEISEADQDEEEEEISDAEEAAVVSEAEQEEAAVVSEAEQEESAVVSEAEQEEEELELFEVAIKGKTYVTNDEIEGDIYEYVNDEVGEIVGTFKNGVAKMIKKTKSSQKK